MIKHLFISICFFAHLTAQIPELRINELLASNAHVNYSPGYRNFSDWIELYNSSGNPINLNGYTLTDNPNNPQKYIINTDLVIEPLNYLILWADAESNGNHTNFNLDADGEFVGIYTADGNVVDTIFYPIQKPDISYGRKPNDLNKWIYFSSPTPNRQNSTVGYSELNISEAPKFSQHSGFFSSNIHLVLSSEPGAEIRYTIDGSEPDQTSFLYENPIYVADRTGDPNYFSEIPTNRDPFPWHINWRPPNGEVFKATVIRAKTYHTDKLPSDIITNTYFVHPMISDFYIDIPIISLVSDEKHLFNDATGIYVPGDKNTGVMGSGNYNSKWTKPANIEYFTKNKESAFNQECDIRIQGRTSVTCPQKALYIIARKKYGIDVIDYPLFSDSKLRANKIKQHGRFLLRAWGTVWNQGMLNDALGQLSVAKTQLDFQDYYPVIVFINGEYWGLQEVREANKDPDYYQEHYGINRNNPGVDILRGGASQPDVDEGDKTHWNNMFDYLSHNDISLTENYQYIEKLIDVENFIDYVGTSIYFSRFDWPGSNEGYWRPRTDGGRWKWILFDMDLAFYNIPYDMFEHTLYGGVENRGPHKVFVHLFNNESFKFKFINWFRDRLNSDFKPEIIQALHNKLLNGLYPYLDEHNNRWVPTRGNFKQYTSFLRNFASERPKYIMAHIKSHFDLDDLSTITVNRSSNGGIIKLNTIFIDESTNGVDDSPYPWSGNYFIGLPIDLVALPNVGYTFSHWEGDLYSESDSISVILDDEISVTAVFKPEILHSSLFINELLADNRDSNIDTKGDYDDWIELYNASEDTILLPSLYLTDNFSNLTKWKFPKSNTKSDTIFPQQFSLIWCDGETNEGSNHANFSLQKEGEQLGIIQIVGDDTVFIDSITFPQQWSNVSYGRVPSGIDQWKYFIPPSPGSNNKSSSIFENDGVGSRLYQNYPNPFNTYTIIPFFNSAVDNISLKIFDLRGGLVKTLISEKQMSGYHEISYDGKDNNGKNISSGIYVYQLRINDTMLKEKMLYIK